MTELNIDFETASQCDLIKEGAYNYAMHPSTEILMMYWAFDDEEPEGWFPGDRFPQRVIDHIRQVDGRINAANAQFERLIWWYVMPKYAPLVPQPRLEQFYCTLYKARCNNMPGKLDYLARALGTFQQKTALRGKELIKLFSILDLHGQSIADNRIEQTGFCPTAIEEVDAAFDEFCDYCAQDVRTERECARMLREPTEEEWEDYWVNEKINDRGVRVDLELAEGAIRYAAEEEAELVGRIAELTDGEAVKARGEKLKAWVMDRLNDDQLRLLVKYRNDEKKYSLDKYNREKLLADPDLDPVVRDVVECSDMAQKSSVGKFKAMINRSHPQTHRVCGAFMANGAAASGRYSSLGLQLHNFPRACMPDVDAKEGIRDDIVEGILAEDIREYWDLPIMTILSRLLRPSLIAGKGNKLVIADWSAIEGRVAPWLTCSRSGEKKLDVYRRGEDPYVLAAAATFGIDPEDVSKDERQIGKVEELSLQYAGGANAFMSMARNYGVQVSRTQAEEFKQAWRASNTWAVDMWDRCESAAFSAVRSPGSMYTVGKVIYFAVPEILGYDMTLFCQLPCGRVLTYPDVRVGQKKAPWGDMVPALSAMRAAWTPKVGDTEWPRSYLYGGLFVENNTQGIAASILRWTLRECDYEGLPIVGDVHDEPIAEVPASETEAAAELLLEIMEDGPEWAEGLPLAAEHQIVDRYTK